MKEWRRIRENKCNKQLDGAKNLASFCGIHFQKPLTLDDFQIIQEKLNDYQLKVIDCSTRQTIFEGPFKQKQIGIEFDENNKHYNAIIKIQSYFNKSYTCEHCGLMFKNKSWHRCELMCKKCLTLKCDPAQQFINCELCNREFYGSLCYQAHLKSTCNSKKKCAQCLVEYRINKKVAHSVQREIDGKIHHIPNLIISLTVCDKCWDNDRKDKSTSSCSYCGKSYRRYWGYDCVKRFCDDIYGEIAPKAEEAKANVYVFAHNAKGYDSHFILRDLFSREFTTKPEIIMVGNKILKLDIGNIRFMDSLCIFQQPLDKLPKAYGLSEIKGFFPHEFNQEANFNYEGPMPDLKYFELEYMTPSKAAEIKCWYDEQVAND
ncbi:hypothetical protein B4U79_00021, partial [Dinothrombium tinctorium]